MNRVKVLAVLFLGFGILLSIISIMGFFTGLGNYKNVPANGERFDHSLATKVKDLENLHAEVIEGHGNWKDIGPEERMNALYNAVIDRFTYGSEAKYNIFSDWIMWGLGFFNANAAYISDPDYLLKYGFSIMCHQTSWVLAMLAKKENIPFRHVELSGHVVMEAWWDNAWHLYDPAFEVIPEKHGKILSVHDLEDKPDLVKSFYGERGDKIASLFTTRENNSYTTNNMFIWKADVLSRIELISNYLKWIIPILMIIAGMLLYLKDLKRKNDTASRL